MDELSRKRIELLAKLTREGYFGKRAQTFAIETANITPGVPFAIEMIRDLYSPKSGDEQLVHNIVDYFVQLLVITYRDANRVDSDVAKAMCYSLIQDYPDVPNTNVYSTFETLIKTSIALQGVLTLKDPLAIEQAALKVIESYNEFLNTLLGFVLACMRTVQGTPVSKKLFKKRYAERVTEFEELTGGENGVYFMLSRILKPALRNSVAHGTIWHDPPNGIFRFPDHRGNLQEMSTTELMMFALVGSHLPHAYVAAVSVIQVMQEGNDVDINRLPDHLVHAFRHVPTV